MRTQLLLTKQRLKQIHNIFLIHLSHWSMIIKHIILYRVISSLNQGSYLYIIMLFHVISKQILTMDYKSITCVVVNSPDFIYY